MHISFQSSVWSSVDICRRKIAESYDSAFFRVFEIPPYCFHSGCTSLHSHRQSTGVRSLFSTSSPVFFFHRLFDDSPSDRCEMVSHCGSDLHFSDDQHAEGIFLCLLAIGAASLKKMSIQVFCTFIFFFMLSSMSCLYVYRISSPYQTFASIFYSVSRLSFCFMDSFLCCARAFKFNEVPFIFAFTSFAFGNRSKQLLLRFMLKGVLPMFSARSFMISGLFRSLIRFEFILYIV